MKKDRPSGLGWLREKRQERIDAGAERLLSRVSTVDAERAPTISASRTLAALLVVPVHLLTVALAGGGGWLVLAGGGPVLKIIGVFALALAVVLRPRLGGMPEHVAMLRPEQAPAFYGVLSQVGARTGAPLPHVVLVSTEFNASASWDGLRRRVLEIGAPLWVAAEPQARVALLGHELGHFAHGDISSGTWIGSGRATLIAWYRFTKPSQMLHVTLPFDALVRVPLRWAVVGWLYLLDRVASTSRRRQEYLADLDAAQVGGTDGAIALMDLLLSDATVEAAMTRGALNRAGPPMWDLVREDVAGRRDNRVARRRTASAELSRADSSHPRTVLRIQLLETRPRETAAVVLDPGTWALVDAELAGALALAAKRAADDIRYVR